MVDVTLVRPLNKGQGHSFWYRTNRFIIHDFLQAVSSNFCSRTHYLATLHYIMYRQTDERNTVA